MTDQEEIRKKSPRIIIPENCKLYEMVQYQCEASLSCIECNPFPRLFLKCAGLPTVEVTPEYDQNGNPVFSIIPSKSHTPS